MALKDKWLILADDLTGACETGGELVEKGLETVVLPSASGPAPPEPVEAIVVNTDSRHLPPAQAARRVRTWFQRAGTARRVYKKTDSTLRGNVGAELEALMEAAGLDSLPFVPAFPQAGRTTQGGIQYVQGVPLAESAFARDPASPVRSSSVREILAGQTSVEVELVSPRALGAAVARPGRRILLFDARTARDLSSIAEAIDACGLTDAAGAAGLLWALVGGAAFSLRKERSSRPEPMLLVNGSLHPVSIEQLEQGIRGGMEEVRILETTGAAGQLAASLRSGRDVALHHPARLGPEQGQGVPDRLAQCVADALGTLETLPILVVLGGQTSKAVVERLDTAYLVPLRRLGPGLIETRARSRLGSLTLVTKSGGFGDPDLLCYLRGIYRERT
jgi:uncharacterized protein YgbK (DUF1537 family)